MSLIPQRNYDEIEAFLNQFEGGDITLSKKYFDKGLAVLYFSNTGKKNAVTGKMMVQFRQCVLELEQWEFGKAVLLCGLGGNFCSGGDLNFAKATGTHEKACYMSTWMQDTLTRLKNLPLISVCLIQGPTLGGGAEISVHCDFIIAAENVRFGFVHGKMGIVTAWGGGTRLVQKIGPSKALKLLLSSQILSAEECFKLNIVDHVVSIQDSFRDAVKWIDLHIQHHYSTIRSLKQIVNKASFDTYQNSLEYEKRLFCVTWGSEINKEALTKNIKHVK